MVRGCVGVALLLMCVPGCGVKWGAVFYWMGAGRMHKVEAEYILSEGPILVLVDDLEGRLTWASTRERLAELLADELVERHATERVISPETVKRYRRTHADFDNLKCAPVGRLVGADQVLWVEVKAFFAEEEIYDTTKAATIAVMVRVINPNERKDRGKVRLWPANREGKPVTVQLRATEVGRLKTKDRIAAELARRSACEIAKLFYKHPLEDVEEN